MKTSLCIAVNQMLGKQTVRTKKKCKKTEREKEQPGRKYCSKSKVKQTV
jgi:hypothetical protein